MNFRGEREDLELEARQKLEAKLSRLPGWEIVKPMEYTSELDLYNKVYETWETYWDPPDIRYYDLVSAETLLLRRWQEFPSMPHLFLYGPAHSGKGQCLKIFQQLAPKPLLFTSVSVAAIYHVIDQLHPTLLMDECDRLGSGERSEYIDAMLQVLNVYEHMVVAMRASREGGAIRLFDLYCPKILAGQSPLPGSLPDRTIRLDMEKNVKNVPIDIEIDQEIRGQLEYYEFHHADHRGLSKEQFKMIIGDNRTTQLWYGLYASCPNPRGQKNLMDLAAEQLRERDQEEKYGELAEVTERVCDWVSSFTGEAIVAVLANVGERKPWHIELSELTQRTFETMPNDQDPNKWLGWKLKKLQIPRERSSGLRYAVVNPRTLLMKVRRYAPHLLTTATTTTTACQSVFAGGK